MRHYVVREVFRALFRLALAFSLFGLASRVPWPPGAAHWIAVGSFALLAASVVVISGTLLYDTLYYDHHWRNVDSR